MATSQATMEALKREARANAKEDMVTLASEARQKVDHAMASVQGLGGKLAHPFDAGAREAAQGKANSLKRQSSEKQANLREMARQTAEEERFAARNQVTQQVLGGAGGMRYPVPVYPPSDAPSQEQQHQSGEEHPQAQVSLGEHTPEHPPVIDQPPQQPREHPPVVDQPPEHPLEHPPPVENPPPVAKVEHPPAVDRGSSPEDTSSTAAAAPLEHQKPSQPTICL